MLSFIGCVVAAATAVKGGREGLSHSLLPPLATEEGAAAVISRRRTVVAVSPPPLANTAAIGLTLLLPPLAIKECAVAALTRAAALLSQSATPPLANTELLDVGGRCYLLDE